MKVRAFFPANKFGFYGGVRRRDGNVFELSDPSHFSESWMVNLDEDNEKPKGKPGPKPKAKAEGDKGE